MQSFADVVHTLLVSIRALEARRSHFPSTPDGAPPAVPMLSLAAYLPYRCEPTRWGEDGSPSAMDVRTRR